MIYLNDPVLMVCKRYLIIAGLLLAQCVTLSSCDDAAINRKAVADRLIIGTSADNPPFEFFTTYQDQQTIQGFDIDLAQAIGEKLHITVEFNDMDFSGLVPALQTGRIDMIMAGMTPSPERQRNLDFTDFYYSAISALLLKQPFDHQLIAPQELENKTIGVQLGSTHESTLKAMADYVPNLTIVSLNRLGDLVQELHSNRIDGVLTEQAIAHAYTLTHKGLSLAVLQGSESSFAAALPRDSLWVDKINAALTELRNEGQLDDIRRKWFPES